MEPDMYRWMLHGLGTPQKTASPGASPYAAADRRFLSPGAFDDHVGQDAACADWRADAARSATRNWVLRAFGEEPAYSTANRMFYANPLVDCRVELGKHAMSRAERQPLYAEVQRLVAVDLPVIPLWHADVRVVTRKRVTGFKPLPNLRLAGLLTTRLEN
jgi:ABC-type transport system substrate-binding protein